MSRSHPTSLRCALATGSLVLATFACAGDPTTPSAARHTATSRSLDDFEHLAATTELVATQQRFAAAIVAGRIDDAARDVDPSRRAAFRHAAAGVGEVGLTEVVTELLEVQPLLDRAAGRVVYHGRGLARPVATTQEWRHDRARGRWFVRPDLAALVSPAKGLGVPASFDDEERE